MSAESITISEIAAFLGILASAGLVQAVCGFGFGLVSVGLLALVWPDVKVATILPILPNLVICGYMLARLRQHMPWRRVAWIWPSTIAGVPLGVWFLHDARLWMVWLGLGMVLIVGGVYGWLPRIGTVRWHPVLAGVPCGLAGGMLSGAFNTGGPPTVAFLSNQQLSYYQYAAGLQLIFVSTSLVRLASLGSFGMLSGRMLALSASGVVAGLLGGALGLALVSRVSAAAMRQSVQAAQVALGLFYLTRI